VAFTKGIKDAAKGLVPERKLDGMIVAFAIRLRTAPRSWSAPAMA
jgi:hypothetical protein